MTKDINAGAGTQTVEAVDQQTQKPQRYKVLFHNDDYTTMEFVVSVLMTIFHHSEGSAFKVMMRVHKAGVGVAGIYTREVAETKVAQTVDAARNYEFPLEVTLEPE